MPDSDVSTETKWGVIRSNLQELLTNQQYNTWFKTMRLKRCSEDRVILAVPNNFRKDWILRFYMSVLRKAIQRAMGKDRDPAIEIEIEVPMKEAPPLSTSLGEEKPVEGNVRAGSPARDPASAPRSDFHLNPSFTFENFVVGPSNRLPYAAALAITESAGRPYNPLFLHGPSGLGKTHLLQAVCHKMLAQNPEVKILFLSCETFINHFISAVAKGDLERFRYKYRHMDILLIDDVHLLANKGRTQEEFFHTFNSLYNNGKQIVLSSDAQPSKIPTLEERLVSRFKWGLVTHIDPPDFETRCAILKMKSRIRGFEIPEDVIAFLAENIEKNIRELEGAITKVIGYSTLMGKKIDMEMTREAMRDVIKKEHSVISIDHIARVVVDRFKLKLSDLQSKKRTKSIAQPRQIAMYIAKEMTNHSLQEIGAYFGGRDHTTVLYACRCVERRIMADDRFAGLVEALVRHMRSNA